MGFAKTHIFILNKVQKLSCLAITGAIKCTPQFSLEIMLDTPPLDIFINNTVLRVMDSWFLSKLNLRTMIP